jgi:Tol biopolymer transport system component
MPLQNGSRLGAYEVVAPLGAGGMGEVYRARDSRLGRDVAIKLLPDAFAQDPERLARFEREAKLLASLHHANIAVLHGLEESDGRRFLVMQCIEGESLAQRLARGALPVPDALEIAAAVAAALEAAHESGIVHRDLKPGNVMVTPAGEVKVLDFGLAKGGAASSSDGLDVSASPTITYAATSAGVVLGTAAYMSPEQARGKSVDRRTDIWSFGCLLYECLSGKQAFSGETVSDIVARILQTEPDWSALPAATPPRVRELLARCLQKDARRRLRDIGDARLELEDVMAGRSAAGVASVVAPRPVPTWRRFLPATLIVVTAALAWFAARATSHRNDAAPLRFTVDYPRGQRYDPQSTLTSFLSPDGATLAVIATDSSGTSRIWLRGMDQVQPRLLQGTEGATMLFWSPDSRELAFFASDRELRRVSVSGGEPVHVCEVRNARGGTWNAQGVMLVAPFSNGGLYRVPASGGELQVVLRPDSAHGETGLRFPAFLADGRHFLFCSVPADPAGNVGIVVGSLDGRREKTLLRAEGRAVSANGWLLYTRKGILTAQRFDPGARRLNGEPISLGDATMGNNYLGSPFGSASTEGSLAFETYAPTPERFAWLDHSGHETSSIPVPPLNLLYAPRVAPDGQHALVVALDREQTASLAIADLVRGVLTPVVPTDAFATSAIWSPDGVQLAYLSETNRQRLIVRSMRDGSEHSLGLEGIAFKSLDDWAPSGRGIVYERLDPVSKWDLWLVPTDGGGAPRPLVHSAANDRNGYVSPDGRWLSFESDRSGATEVYVAPFDGAGMPYQVTTSGGLNQGWSREGHLIFTDARHPQDLMQSTIVPGPSLALSTPSRYFAGPGSQAILALDPARDRILGAIPAGDAPRPTVTVIRDWTGLLKRR